MQERTGDGYVFRTDLRLRPDPGATQVALSTDAALQLLRELRAELGARRPDQGARRSPATSRRGAALAGRSRALHLAQVSRLRGDRRHPRHEAADPRLRGLRRDRRRRPQHQARPRRHPRDRVLRPDPAADRRRPAAGPARAARRSTRSTGWRRAAGSSRERARRSRRAPTLFLRRIEHRLQMVADEQTHDAAGGCRDAGAPRAVLRLSPTRRAFAPRCARARDACSATMPRCSRTCRS